MTSEKISAIRMEKCLFNKEEIELPEALLEDCLVFCEVLSQQTWTTYLTDDICSALLKLLPQFPENDLIEKQITLEMLFLGKNFKFGNPLKQFHKKLKDGRYLPDIVRYSFLCLKAKQQEYRFQQEIYYKNLLCEILLNRQTILEELYQNPPEASFKFDHIYWSQHSSKQRNKSLSHRVNQKCHWLIREVNEECGQAETSSDEEEISFVGSNVLFPLSGRSQGQQHLKQMNWAPNVYLDSPDFEQTSVLDTFAPKSVFVTPVSTSSVPVLKKWNHSSGKHQLLDVTGEDYQDLMRKHKKRKIEYPDHPELNTVGMTLDDVISRTQISRKVKSSSAVNSKKKFKKAEAVKKVFMKYSEMELSSTVIVGNTSMLSQGSSIPNAECINVPDLIDVEHLLSIKKENSDEEIDVQDCSYNQMTGSRQSFGQYAHFFSLLKDLMHEDTEDKLVTSKLEEKVREWQESDSVGELNPWFRDQANWVDLVSSALKFLSGDMLGLSLPNFIPLLDYKERAQQWRWIGQGRDTDEELANLYAYWTEHRESDQLDSGFDKMASVPPPRMWTEYVVHPSTEEERLQFQAQEKERFSNPHKAYTYRMHDYESVVGPVKGVYAKENAIIKAREHALLVKDRPSYVTILTLVHDGAARLPNGEGTRNDICELLKDSQFLAPGVTESQINTVVSGALDRLHYEKDPCVKYDGTRKVWIYRHRNRNEEEFEKIHQAQAAAVKAKKMALPKKSKFAKPSIAKKVKDPTNSAAQKLLETLLVQSSNLDSSPASTAVTHSTVPYSPSSFCQSTAMTNADVAATLPSSSCNQIFLEVQKSVSIDSSIAYPPMHSLVAEPVENESDLVSTVFVSVPSKVPTMDILQHQVSSGAKPFTISLVQQQKSVAVTTLPSSIQTQLISVSKPVAFSLIQSHVAGSKAVSCSALSSTSCLPSFSASSSLSCSDIYWPQSKAVVFPPPPSSAQSDGPKTKIVALQQLSKSLHLPFLSATHLQQVKNFKQQQSSNTTAFSTGCSLAVLQASSQLCPTATSASSRSLVGGNFQFQQQNHSNVVLPVGLTSASGKPRMNLLPGEKSSFTVPSASVELEESNTSVNMGEFSQSDSVSVISSSPTTASIADSAPIMTHQLSVPIFKTGVKTKPVFISGKSATVSTSVKSFSIGGKQMLVSRGGGGGGGRGGGGGGASSTSVGQHVVTTSTVCLTSGLNVFNQSGITLAAAPRSAMSSSLVSHILQPGTLLSQQGAVFRGGLVRVSGTGQVLFSGNHPLRAQGQERVSGNGQIIFSGQQPQRAGVQSQIRVGSPSSGQMKLMSISTGALGQAARIIVPDQNSLIVASPVPAQSVSDLNVDRKATIMTSYANIVGTQMFLQPSTGMPIYHQQSTLPGSVQSASVYQNAKSEQNIQIIKSLITPGNKQHPTAILLTNPTTQSLPMAVEHDNEKSDSGLVNATNVRQKPGPVFARIINPPASLQIAGMHQSQMLTQGQLSLQGLAQVSSGSHLTLDSNQIQQLVAAQQRNADSVNRLDTTISADTEST